MDSSELLSEFTIQLWRDSNIIDSAFGILNSEFQVGIKEPKTFGDLRKIEKEQKAQFGPMFENYGTRKSEKFKKKKNNGANSLESDFDSSEIYPDYFLVQGPATSIHGGEPVKQTGTEINENDVLSEITPNTYMTTEKTKDPSEENDTDNKIENDQNASFQYVETEKPTKSDDSEHKNSNNNAKPGNGEEKFINGEQSFNVTSTEKPQNETVNNDMGSVEGRSKNETSSMEGKVNNRAAGMEDKTNNKTASMDGKVNSETASMEGKPKIKTASLDGKVNSETASMEGRVENEIASVQDKVNMKTDSMENVNPKPQTANNSMDGKQNNKSTPNTTENEIDEKDEVASATDGQKMGIHNVLNTETSQPNTTVTIGQQLENEKEKQTTGPTNINDDDNKVVPVTEQTTTPSTKEKHKELETQTTIATVTEKIQTISMEDNKEIVKHEELSTSTTEKYEDEKMKEAQKPDTENVNMVEPTAETKSENTTTAPLKPEEKPHSTYEDSTEDDENNIGGTEIKIANKTLTDQYLTKNENFVSSNSDMYKSFNFKSLQHAVKKYKKDFSEKQASEEESCPRDTYGPTCIPPQVCAPEEEFKIKLLTRDMFDELNLDETPVTMRVISNSANRTNNVPYTSKEFATHHKYHNKIRVRCKGNGQYELETCRPGLKLTRHLNCVPYDICKDHHPNGYIHFEKTDRSDGKLLQNEYYECQNKTSHRRQCQPYHVLLQTVCVPNVECNSAEPITYVHNSSYLATCSRYRENNKLTFCEFGVHTSNGKFECKPSKCVEGEVIFEDKYLRYATGINMCENGSSTPLLIQCNTEKISLSRVMSWDVTFSYTIENWPLEILNGRECVPPDWRIVKNPIRKLRFSHAMAKEHDFNILTEEFVCNEKFYAWNYQNNSMTPQTQMVFDTAQPCQEAPLALKSVVPYYMEKYKYPKDKPFICISTPAYLPAHGRLMYLWPMYSPEEKKIFYTAIEQTKDFIIVKTHRMKWAPTGFRMLKTRAATKDFTPLVLKGTNPARTNATLPIRNHVYFVISTGHLSMIPVGKFPSVETIYHVPIVDRVTRNNLLLNGTEYRFSLDWLRVKRTFKLVNEVTITPTGFTYRDQEFDFGYNIMTIRVNTANIDTGILTIGEAVPHCEFSLTELQDSSFYEKF